MSLSSPDGKRVILAPVRPNVGIEAAYRARLDALVMEMNLSLVHWLGAAYRRQAPEVALLAADASPARELSGVMDRLSRAWRDRFDDASLRLARWFARQAVTRSDAALRLILRKAGLTVRFTMTRAANDAYQAVIAENVGLIKSIASEHLTQVQGMVMRSVQQGRDLAGLVADLEREYGVTRRRASLIARDQNNKATAVISRVRHQELGISEAIWLHSFGGKTPRPTHLRAGRERTVFSLADGWYDPDEGRNIWPGELINCRCVSRPVLPAR